jgi:hypothetical protein
MDGWAERWIDEWIDGRKMDGWEMNGYMKNGWIYFWFKVSFYWLK